MVHPVCTYQLTVFLHSFLLLYRRIPTFLNIIPEVNSFNLRNVFLQWYVPEIAVIKCQSNIRLVAHLSKRKFRSSKKSLFSNIGRAESNNVFRNNWICAAAHLLLLTGYSGLPGLPCTPFWVVVDNMSPRTSPTQIRSRARRYSRVWTPGPLWLHVRKLCEIPIFGARTQNARNSKQDHTYTNISANRSIKSNIF